MQKTLITLNGKPINITIPQMFDQKYTNLKFVTFSFSPQLINDLAEYMHLQGIIGSAYNKSLTQKSNFRYAVNKVHTKVMLLSNDFGDLRVIKGSANLSNRALDQNSNQGENIEIIDNNEDEYNRWLKYFNSLWQKAGNLKQPDPLVKLPHKHALSNAEFKDLYSKEANNQRQALASIGFQGSNRGLKETSDLIDKLNGFQNLKETMHYIENHYWSEEQSAKHHNRKFICTPSLINSAKSALALLIHYEQLFNNYLYDCFPEYKQDRLIKINRYNRICQKVFDTVHTENKLSK